MAQIPTSLPVNLNDDEKSFLQRRAELLTTIDTDYAMSVSHLLSDRRAMGQTLARIKLFEMSLSVLGSIVECGSHRGNGLGLYYHLSSVLEPTNFNRKILSFDTFAGFPSTSDKDEDWAEAGMLSDVNFQLIQDAIEINDLDRSIGHIPKVEFVIGDACQTIPKYVEDNQHLLISYLYLDFDIYAPTKVALECLLPLVPKGGVVAFDELAQKKWVGETIAFKEVLLANNARLKKFYFEPHISYFVLGD